MRVSLDRLWLVIAIGLPVLVALLVPMPAVDLAYQVRAGDEILRGAAIPATDTWTFTVAGTPWTDQQWLAQVLLALGYRAGGWELLAVLRAALVGLALALSIGASMARGAGTRMAAILALLVFALSAPALALRPQLFGITIFAGLLWLVAVRRSHPAWYWAAPVLVALWANLHGSFVLAPLVLGYAWLDDVARGRPSRQSLAVLLLGVAATLVNPFGPGVWAYAAGIGANPAITDRVSEWQRTTPLTVPGALFYASADRDPAGDGPRSLGAPLAGLAVDRGHARDRRVDRPRPRLVAVRGGVRRRCGPARRARPALGGGSGAIRPAEPDRRAHRHAVPARDRHLPALVAAGRPADGPHGAPGLCPVRAGAGGPGHRRSRRPGVPAPDVGVVVRMGGAPTPATSSTPGSSCSRRPSGTTTTRSPGAAPTRRPRWSAGR